MTSRREFFGLLAAVPLVALAIAKEMVATPSHQISSSFAVAEGEWVEIRQIRLEDFRRGIRSVNEIRQMEGLPPIGCVTDVPNRLYGAQINADGEAV